MQGFFIIMKKNNTYKYSFTLTIVAVILLFLSGQISSITAQETHRCLSQDTSSNSLLLTQQIIYVDDDNTQGPWNGTLQYPYQYIQDAIDTAQSGDCIYVFNGIYYENIYIDKQVTIMGEYKKTTIIDGSNEDKTVSISCDNVTLTNCTVQNCGNFFQDAGIFIQADHCLINNTILWNNTEGIYLWNANHITINKNSFTSCKNGLNLKSSNDNMISSNIFSNNLQAICLEQSSTNTIQKNIITHNQDGISVMVNCNQNLIVKNHIASNTGVGILFIQLFDKQNQVQNNNFIENTNHASFELSFWIQWTENYWDDWFGLTNPSYDFLPKLIVGTFIANFPWLNLDWKPATKPYTI